MTTVAGTPQQKLKVDGRRVREDDADYQRLHARTVARLTASIARLVRELRNTPGHEHSRVTSAFIARHTALLRGAYADGHRAGVTDYWGSVSKRYAKTQPRRFVPQPGDKRLKQRLAFYAPSVAKMAHEALIAAQATAQAAAAKQQLKQQVQLGEHAYRLTYVLADPDPLSTWQQGVAPRVELQAQISWPGLQDGYVDATGVDPASPFAQLWWDLEPAAQHCFDCPQYAAGSPYDRPGSGGNELDATPGDGHTECGAACKCSLHYEMDTKALEQASESAYDFGQYLKLWSKYNFLPDWQPAPDEEIPFEPATGTANPTTPPTTPPTAEELRDQLLDALDRYRQIDDAWHNFIHEDIVANIAGGNAVLLPELPDFLHWPAEDGDTWRRLVNELPDAQQELLARALATVIDASMAQSQADALGYGDLLAPDEIPYDFATPDTADASGESAPEDIPFDFDESDDDGYWLGGHEPGYEQNRDAHGHWAAGDGGSGGSGEGGLGGSGGEGSGRSAAPMGRGAHAPGAETRDSQGRSAEWRAWKDADNAKRQARAAAKRAAGQPVRPSDPLAGQRKQLKLQQQGHDYQVVLHQQQMDKAKERLLKASTEEEKAVQRDVIRAHAQAVAHHSDESARLQREITATYKRNQPTEHQNEPAAPRLTLERANEHASATEHALFGRELTAEEAGRLGLAEPGAHVRLRGSPAGTHLQVVVEGPHAGHSTTVYIARDAETGRTTLMEGGHRSNQGTMVRRADGSFEFAGVVEKPYAPEALRAQVHTAQQLGIHEIHAKARTSQGEYMSLPRLGFNAGRGHISTESHSALPSWLSKAHDLAAILATPAAGGPNGHVSGRDWWQANGRNPGLTLDLTPGSHGMRTFAQWEQSQGTQGTQPGGTLAEPDSAGVLRLTGGHQPGYTQNRDKGGRFAPGDGGRQEATTGEGGRLSVARESGGGKGYHLQHTGSSGEVVHEAHNTTLTKVNAYAKEQGIKGRLTAAHFAASAAVAKGKAEANGQVAKPKQPTAEEQKAAAELRVRNAQAAVMKAERAYRSAERTVEQRRVANAAEIDRATAERHDAYLAEFKSHDAVKDRLLDERARANGAAGKSPVVYQKMLAAEQPMKDARAAYETAQKAADASTAHYEQLLERYRAQHQTPGSGYLDFDGMRKAHPDFKAAANQRWKDASAADKAKYAMWRKESTYNIARGKVAGYKAKELDAAIAAHPDRIAAQARLAAATAKLGEVTGETAWRKASDAREAARAELQDAQLALKHPTWKYTLHSAPITKALYTKPEQWPEGALAAARKSDNMLNANADRHVGDLALHELQHAQGFDGKADIVSEDELNQHVKAGEQELWRGDTKEGHTDNFMMGDYHTGLGIRGNGTYAQAAEVSGKETARSYAKDHGNNGLMMRMTVKHGARVIDYEKLGKLAHKTAQDALKAETDARARGDKVAEEHAKTLHWLASTEHGSRLAVALGYDAIRIPSHGQWIVLNRTALRISHQVHG